MKKMTIVLIMAALLAAPLISEGIGSAQVTDRTDYTLEQMLQYAMEDEQMALAEYQAIMEKFNVTRPYENIARSEETHISYLNELYGKYNLTIPAVDTEAHLMVPTSLSEAANLGVQAEIANIAMYEQFLKSDLPSDVKEVFTLLKNASQNHLTAFERQAARY